MVKPTPINPSTARSHRRRARLNETARAYGFDTWTQLETAILNRNVVLMFTDKKKNPGSTTMDTGNGERRMGEPPPTKPYHTTKEHTMYRKTTTPEIDAIWDAFNAEVFAAASAHLPHDVDAYEHARARAYAKAIGAVNAITREQLERRWRQPASLVPFDSDLS